MREAIAFFLILAVCLAIAVVATREHQAPYAMVLVKVAVPQDETKGDAP
jgi:hypothetical protein